LLAVDCCSDIQNAVTIRVIWELGIWDSAASSSTASKAGSIGVVVKGILDLLQIGIGVCGQVERNASGNMRAKCQVSQSNFILFINLAVVESR